MADSCCLQIYNVSVNSLYLRISHEGKFAVLMLLCIVYFQRLSTVMPQCFHSTAKEIQTRGKSRSQRAFHPGTAGECSGTNEIVDIHKIFNFIVLRSFTFAICVNAWLIVVSKVKPYIYSQLLYFMIFSVWTCLLNIWDPEYEQLLWQNEAICFCFSGLFTTSWRNTGNQCFTLIPLGCWTVIQSQTSVCVIAFMHIEQHTLPS